jgi:hypothetical protein
MAAAEQLKELGEKLQAVAPAPADELAKLLEVRYPKLLRSGWLRTLGMDSAV